MNIHIYCSRDVGAARPLLSLSCYGPGGRARGQRIGQTTTADRRNGLSAVCKTRLVRKNRFVERRSRTLTNRRCPSSPTPAHNRRVGRAITITTTITTTTGRVRGNAVVFVTTPVETRPDPNTRATYRLSGERSGTRLLFFSTRIS